MGQTLNVTASVMPSVTTQYTYQTPLPITRFYFIQNNQVYLKLSLKFLVMYLQSVFSSEKDCKIRVLDGPLHC